MKPTTTAPKKATSRKKTTKKTTVVADQTPPPPDHNIEIPEKLRNILLDLGDRERTLNIQLQGIKQQRDSTFQAFLIGNKVDDPANIQIDQQLRCILVWDKK